MTLVGIAVCALLGVVLAWVQHQATGWQAIGASVLIAALILFTGWRATGANAQAFGAGLLCYLVATGIFRLSNRKARSPQPR